MKFKIFKTKQSHTFDSYQHKKKIKMRFQTGESKLLGRLWKIMHLLIVSELTLGSIVRTKTDKSQDLNRVLLQKGSLLKY
jgi:hypothetical protein